LDVIVTTPKSEHEVAREEAEAVKNDPEAYWFRTLRGHPNVQVGDRVYYVDNGVITGYGVVFGITHGDEWDDSHERNWRGTNLKQRVWVSLKVSIPYRGFQGFRYVNHVAGLREKLLAAEE